jgi:hypothetical protein
VEAAIFFLGFEDRALKEYIMFSRKRILSRAGKFAGFGALLLALFVAPLVTGCSNPSNSDDPTLVGKWVSSYGDYYVITGTTVIYNDNYEGDMNYVGTIRKITYFNATSGVIIIEYTAGNKPKYWDYDTSPPYAKTGNPADSNNPWPPQGDFLGIYFKNLTSTSIEFANATDITQMGHDTSCEAITLEAAISKFTLDAVDDFVYLFGSYAKQ